MEPRAADLVRRFQDGDESASELLFRRSTPTTLGLIYAFVGRVQDAEDLVQEVFLEAQKSIAHLRNPASFSSWLYKITQRVCNRWLREQQRAPKGLESPEDIVDAAESAADDEQLRIRATVDGMAQPLREVIYLRYFHAASYEQMGTTLGISASAVNARLMKARKILKIRLEQIARSRA